jgi:hypothetical protein
MNNISKDFRAFRTSFDKKEISDSLKFIGACFKVDPKNTILKLYQGKFLFNKEFIEINLGNEFIPEPYRLLFEIINRNLEGLTRSSVFIEKYSKKQILQGAANFLEKRNAQLKYNEAWNIKYANADVRYLETERQGMYFTTAGIEFQELLNRYYCIAKNIDEININWNHQIELSYNSLFSELFIYNELKDTIERHLFFDWSLETHEDKILKTNPPSDQIEGKTETDLINLLKSKLMTEISDNIAQQKLAHYYLNDFQTEIPKLDASFKHKPDLGNEEEMTWFMESFMLSVSESLNVERELAIYRHKYFPGIEELTELEFKDRTKLPLKAAFRILSYICSYSKKQITEIDDQYSKGVAEYSEQNSSSSNMNMIDIMSRFYKGNKEALKDTIKEYQNDEVYDEQTKIINNGKKNISNDKSLIRYNLKKLVKVLQWLYQYEEDFITSVLDMFIYNGEESHDVTRTPFFIIGDELCWMPNMVAYASFAENLIENLLYKESISIHGPQSKQFENHLNLLFKKYGYKVINDYADKQIYNEDGINTGDFDVLAYKNGTLIYMELKLTHTRNGYYERYDWKQKKLIYAATQLDKGLKHVKENPEHIKRILGLRDDEKIERTEAFIISNSFLYDHEKIGNYLKIGYFQAMYSLILTEESADKNADRVESYIRSLYQNRLFENIHTKPISTTDTHLKVGDYFIQRPGLLQQNVYTAL